ncbi:hypothetical protein WME79_17695 [Sorangium sp. So ce726]|uniref:hypothetical protein n=1 Tax=Sorangium sp. So ce726 TaxID=3133319 RepID=UPI003F607E3F
MIGDSAHGALSARFLHADAMLRRLRQSRLDNSRDAEMVALTTVDLLIVDDFALEAMKKESSRDVYQLSLERTDVAPRCLAAAAVQPRSCTRARRDEPVVPLRLPCSFQRFRVLAKRIGTSPKILYCRPGAREAPWAQAA